MAVNIEPFPHLILENALTNQDYIELVAAWPDEMEKSKDGLKYDATPKEEFHWKKQLAEMLMDAFKVTGTPSIGRYMLRKPGYSLEPHADPPNLVTTVLHYLPEEGQSEEAGTILYKAADPIRFKKSGANYFRGIECTPQIVVPYRRNLVLAFFNGRWSAHGLAPLKEERRLYQWHLTKL